MSGCRRRTRCRSTRRRDRSRGRGRAALVRPPAGGGHRRDGPDSAYHVELPQGRGGGGDVGRQRRRAAATRAMQWGRTSGGSRRTRTNGAEGVAEDDESGYNWGPEPSPDRRPGGWRACTRGSGGSPPTTRRCGRAGSRGGRPADQPGGLGRDRAVGRPGGGEQREAALPSERGVGPGRSSGRRDRGERGRPWARSSSGCSRRAVTWRRS